MNRITHIFRFVFRGGFKGFFSYTQIFSTFLFLLIAVNYCTAQEPVKTNNIQAFDEQNHYARNGIIDTLEKFYVLNFTSDEFWNKRKIHWKGDSSQFEKFKPTLYAKLHKMNHENMIKSLINKRVNLFDLNELKNKISYALDSMVMFYTSTADDNSLSLYVRTPEPEVRAPVDVCDNMNFDNCNFSNWITRSGSRILGLFTANITTTNTTFGTGANTGFQHNILNNTAANDPIINTIKQVMPGGTCSAMVGNYNGTGTGASRVTRSFLVNTNTLNFFYSYAVILEDGGHSANEQPFFAVRMFDQNNVAVPCATFNVFATDGSPEWRNGGGNLRYMDWQSSFIPLQAFIGQTVTIEFTTADCSQGGHYAYAYVEASCVVTSTMKDTMTCKGKPVTLTAPLGPEYRWSTGATTKTISTSTPGTYWVEMGRFPNCTRFDTVVVGLYNSPKANFTTDTACLGKATKFTDKSIPAGGIASWKWDFLNVNATNSTLQNPTNVYASAGTKTAKLTVANNSGCMHDTTFSVFVEAQPTANFTSNTICQGDSTTFTNLSTGNVFTNKWDFYNNGASVSNKQNPKFLYAVGPTYNAKLKVTSLLGCSDSVVKAVNFHPLPDANFTQTDVCQLANMNFLNTSMVSAGSITSWSWNFGDTTFSAVQTPTHAYTYYGSRPVKLKVTTNNGCIDSIVKNVNIYENPKVNFTVDNVCHTKNITLSNLSTITTSTFATWQWDILKDAAIDYSTKDASHLFAGAGTYYILLKGITAQGCSDTTEKSVTVYPLPKADFNLNTVCEGDTTSFTNNSTISSGTIQTYKWDFYNNGISISNKQNPKFLYAVGSTYNAKLKVTSLLGCSDSVVKAVNFHPLPDANFTQTDVCQLANMNFVNTSTVSAGSITSWSWNFGDTTFSALQTPTHAYTYYGSRPVKLKVTTNNGCIDSIVKNATIYENPRVNFTVGNVCHTKNVTLSNLSTVTTSTFSTWQWDILKDATIDYSTKDASHLFAGAGTYYILLKGITTQGCSDTTEKSVTVYPLPKADFTASVECKNVATTFTDKSTSAVITQWKWDFQNNNSYDNNNQNTNFTYPNYGSYVAKHTVISDKGCADSITKTVVVDPLPVANFTSVDVCFPEKMMFTNTSTIPTGSIKINQWKMGDLLAGTSSTVNTSYNYASYGNYNVKLIVTSDSSCTDSITKPVKYFEKPKTNFTLSNVCKYTDVPLNNTSTITSSTIKDWKWDMTKDGSTDYTIKNPLSHKYANDGSYTIQLITITNDECKDTLEKPIVVYASPKTNFSANNSCVSDSASFSDLSTSASGTITNWTWNFNDGTNSTSKSPKHKFLNQGIYPVNLIVNSSFNCKDTLTKSVEIWPLPVVGFSCSEVCLNEASNFKNASTISSSITPNSITQYQWKFISENTSTTNAEPSNIFKTDGIHNVRLIATSSHSCVDSTTKTITVNPLPIPKFTSSLPQGCASWCVQFSNISTVKTGNISGTTWNYGDASSSNILNGTHCYINETLNPIKYSVTLKTITNKGCIKDTVVKDYVTVFPKTIANFSSNTYELTEGDPPVVFTNLSTGADSWKWFFGDSTTDVLEHTEHHYSIPKTYEVSLVSNNKYNCADTAKKTLKVIPVYSYFVPNSFTPNGDGKNDVFYVYGYNIIQFELLIFNRWGEKVFVSTNMNEGWNGTYMGNEAQIDTYVYKVNLTDIFGKSHEIIGHVNIIK